VKSLTDLSNMNPQTDTESAIDSAFDTDTTDSSRDNNKGATERAIQQLSLAIQSGLYAPGQRLIETSLTKQLGVSRGSLREALRRLAADGLVTLKPHHSATVRMMDHRAVIAILEVREVLEGLAASQAAKKIGEQENRERALELKLEVKREQAEGDIGEFLENNIDFHHAIIDLTGNRVLYQQVEQLQIPSTRAVLLEKITRDKWVRSLSDHMAIVDAILDGDALLAEHLMRAHIRVAKKHFEIPDDNFNEIEGNDYG